MSTARERQERDQLIECGKVLERVGNHITENCISHTDSEDLIKVIHLLAKSMEFVVYRVAISYRKDRTNEQ